MLPAQEISRGFGSWGSGLHRGLEGFLLLRVTEQINTKTSSLQSPVKQRNIPSPLLLEEVGRPSVYLNIKAALCVKVSGFLTFSATQYAWGAPLRSYPIAPVLYVTSKTPTLQRKYIPRR